MSQTLHFSHDAELIARLVVATIVCGAIGAERQHRGHEAGLRTFGLIGLGSAGLVALSGDAFAADAGKVIAGIITGVGFLGAGMLIRSGETVRNLTSAAASWASAAFGAAIGAGRYAIGLTMAALALFMLEIPYVPGVRRLDAAAKDHDLRP